MAKKAKEVKDLVKKEVQVTLENIKVGMVIPDLHGAKVKVDKDLISQMEAYEKANPKSHAIYKGKITGTFLYFKYYEDNPAEKKAKKKPSKKPKAEPEEIEVEEDEELEFDEEEELDDEDIEELEEDIEETTKLDEALEVEVEDEENLLKDAMEDYKSEFGVKKVNTNTKKFKAFFEKFKQTE